MSSFRGKDGRFLKGTHWRKRKPFWSKSWCIREYIDKKRSASDIADQFNVKETSIYFWLNKHSIPRRTTSQIRKLKHWGPSGRNNSMFGRTGQSNPNWKGGITPERQLFYSSLTWKRAVRKIRKRDGSKCRRCGSVKKKKRSLHLHHILGFYKWPKYRCDVRNIVTLCSACHGWVHSKANMKKEWRGLRAFKRTKKLLEIV